ncbi:DNA pilot protein [Microviridae sp.]|nr:DNA pilot protein [Microviridae sp.]
MIAFDVQAPQRSSMFSALSGFLGKVAPIAGILGGLSSGSKQRRSIREMNERQIGLAREQMRFQERMSSTAYQRAAKDLEKAGLNRVLAIGSGASSPSGAMPTLSEPVGPSVSTAVQASKAAIEIKNAMAQTKVLNAQAKDTEAAAALKRAQTTVLAPATIVGGLSQEAAALYKKNMSNIDWTNLRKQLYKDAAAAGHSAQSLVDEVKKTMKKLQGHYGIR